MEKILIFQNNRIKEYWFRYILYKLSNGNNLFFKAYLYKHEIWINGNRILFKSEYEVNTLFRKGRHNTKYYNDMENKLENNFKETLKEIFLDGESGN